MRKRSIAFAALLFTVSCSSSHHEDAGRPTPTPSASPSSSPSSSPSNLPVRSGTVHDKRTSFRVRLSGVRTTKSFSGYGETATATSGDTLILVNIHITNTGNSASALTVDEPQPVILHARSGSSYGPQWSWFDQLGVKPGKSRTVVFMFDVPKRTKAGSVTVSVPDTHGDLSTVQLKVP